ncbi:MAG: repair protein radA protein [Candidatus Collierbacteria bacterium GW2011_GWA1_45_15]|nr:MAG: repair protein radA protein [Candidatus Collierbacteria bacterium GW2011_GWA1_45_15]HCX25481.1 DNA repair protein RadA [Candidatus Collierbacteria bacterium]
MLYNRAQMPKSTSVFFCNSCGNEFAKWAGQCPACHEWNTLVETAPFLKTARTKTGQKVSLKPAESFTVKTALSSQTGYTFSTGIGEFDRVLGPGLTKGGVYLLAGQPGIGKSTLLTQLALSLQPPLSRGGGQQAGGVLYVCSEENPAQVASRITRLQGLSSQADHIQLLNTSCVENIIDALKPTISNRDLKSESCDLICIVDSIQSVSTVTNPTTPGSPSQIRDSASFLIQAAKEHSVPLIIVGHVTKDGDIAGPKMLEHMVDTVLELSGDRQHLLRLLRTVKNRFGPTDETGIFRMDGGGLNEVKDPGAILLEGRVKNAPGSCLTMIMEGTRPLTVEIQALVVASPLPIPRRIAKGISGNRLQLICAILTKHLNLSLATKDVFVNVTGGLEVKDPGADLGIALAIVSSVKDKPLPENSICFGELGLLGEIRKVGFTDKMLKEAKSLGYTIVFSPLSHASIRSIKLT